MRFICNCNKLLFTIVRCSSKNREIFAIRARTTYIATILLQSLATERNSNCIGNIPSSYGTARCNCTRLLGSVRSRSFEGIWSRVGRVQREVAEVKAGRAFTRIILPFSSSSFTTSAPSSSGAARRGVYSLFHSQ